MWSTSADRWASPSKARNAFEVFDQAKDLPVEFWGFKDKGLDRPRMCELVKRMKDAGRTTFLESVHYQQSECLEAAEVALGCDVDYLTGTIYYDSILERVKDRPMKYFPFFGHIHGHPVVLDGSGGPSIQQRNRSDLLVEYEVNQAAGSSFRCRTSGALRNASLRKLDGVQLGSFHVDDHDCLLPREVGRVAIALPSDDMINIIDVNRITVIFRVALQHASAVVE